MADNKNEQIVLGLDIPKTVRQINADIKKLEKQLAQVKATGALDTSAAVQQINSQIAKLQAQLNTININANVVKNVKLDNSLVADDSKVNDSITRLNEQLRKNGAYAASAKNKIQEWIKELEKGDVAEAGLWQTFTEGIKSFAKWGASSDVVTEVVQAVKTLINVSKELDVVMTDFTMATGTNETQLKSLTNTYSKLADELSATTTDVMASATEWIKQGQSVADSETLTANTMILSKIGKLDSADATKYLISAMKGYQVSAQDTLSIVDKLSAVDMTSDTDVSGLAQGMGEVADNANLAGVSMDKLLGYLAVIGETTQSSMSEVGTSLNAIFSRMDNIKSAKLKDYQNNGEDLSNVENVLRGEGISLRESSGEFRNFGEVLDEVAGNWTNYSEVSQRAIAGAFAGTNHMENFLVLMSQYDTALKYTETSLGSSGEAMEKFEDYQKSVTAHTELFNNAVQDLANTAIDSGLVNFFIDLGTFGVKALDGITSFLTPLGTLGVTLGAILGGKNIGERV